MNTNGLQERVERCVCKLCGGKIEAKLIIYNKYGGSGLELYCPNCKKIEYGTEPEIYRIARDLVDNVEFDYFTDLEAGQRHYQLNVAKVCEILGWVFKKVEIMDSNGLNKEKKCNFNYPEV